MEMDSWAEFRAEIDRRLDQRRPARSSQSEKDWREPVYGWARNHIPDESNLVRHVAEHEVDVREGRATKRGNKFLRHWAKGQMPLLWADLGALPVLVEGVRIRLDAVTPDDIEDAARELDRNAKNVYDEVLVLTDGMRDLARSARRQGLPIVALLGDLKPRGTDEGIAPDVDDDVDDDDG